MKENSVRPRWWPLVLLIAAGIAALAFVWLGGAPSRQARVMNSAKVVVLSGALFGLWFVFLSRLRWRIRLLGLALAVGVGALGAALFEIRGVTGDLVPILSWRWGDDGDALAATGVGGVALSGRPASPQFLGPQRNGVISGAILEPDWKAHPPEELWRIAIGEGFSSFAVVGDLAITQEQRGDDELVVAYHRDTGAVVWLFTDRARYSTPIAGTGPRATPTVESGRVFALGATGRLHALDLGSGELLWSRDLIAEHGGKLPSWGAAGAPLVSDGRVIVNAGGDGASLVAYEAASGDLVWQAGSEPMAPMLAELAGERQIVHFHKASVAGYRPEDGSLLWSHPWSRAQPNVAQPLPLPGDRLLVSSGYGIGGEALQLTAEGSSMDVSVDWTSTRIKAKFASPVFFEGSIYGLDDGVLTCLDPATGQRRWKRGRYGHGQVLLAGALLLIQAEGGDVVLVEANPEEHIEVATLPALSQRTWNPPALAGDQLFVRNDREAVAYRLKTR